MSLVDDVRRALTPLVGKRVSLSDTNLTKLPFRFVFDIVVEVLRSTNFAPGLYSEPELDPIPLKSIDDKAAWLDKVVKLVENHLGTASPVKARDIVVGSKPDDTRAFLTAFAQVASGASARRSHSSAPAAAAAAEPPRVAGSSSLSRPRSSSSSGSSSGSTGRGRRRPSSSNTTTKAAAAMSDKERRKSADTTKSSKSKDKRRSSSRGTSSGGIDSLPTAIVKAVPTGDTLILLGKPKNPKEAPREKLIMLASLYAPRFALSKKDEEEPFGWASREFLRKKLIGKTIHFKVEYKIEKYGNREFGTVYYHGENMSHVMVKSGLANVIPADEGEARSSDYELLLKLEEEAQTKGVGMFTQDQTVLRGSGRDVIWAGVDGMATVKKFRGKPVPALVEQVLNGSTLRLWLLPTFRYCQLFMSGIQCPGFRPPEYAGGPEQPAPFAREAKLFTERRLLHREVQVILEDVDNAQKGFKKVTIQNYIGTVIIPEKPDAKIREELLKEGLARVDEGCKDKDLIAAQKTGQQRRVRLWKLSPVINKAEVLQSLRDKNPWVKSLALSMLDATDLKNPDILLQVFAMFEDPDTFTIPRRVLSDEEREFVDGLVEIMENKESWWDRCIKPDKKYDMRTEGLQIYWVQNMAQRVMIRDDTLPVGPETLNSLIKASQANKNSPYLVRNWIDQNFRRFEWGDQFEAAYKKYVAAAVQLKVPCLEFMFKGTREKLLSFVADLCVKSTPPLWDLMYVILRKGQDIGAKAVIEAMEANVSILKADALPMCARIANREYYPKKAFSVMKKLEANHPVANGYLAVLGEKNAAKKFKEYLDDAKQPKNNDMMHDLLHRARDLKFPKHFPLKELMEQIDTESRMSIVRWADFPDDTRQQLLKTLLTATKGYVKAVLSGDTVVVVSASDMAEGQASGPPPEKLITLASLMAPALSRGPSSQDHPYAWESREWLRKKLIGKTISFRVEYHEPQKREFATVFLGDDNINDAAVSAGWCKIQPIDGPMPRSQDYEHLCQLEEAAKKAKKGLWNEGEQDKHTRKPKWKYDQRKFLEKNKGKQLKGLVEQVLTGSQLRVTETDEYHYFMLVLNGIECPGFKKPPSPSTPAPAQPFAKEARFFSEDKMLNREVIVTIDGMTKENYYSGSISLAEDESFDLRIALVKEGLARVVSGEKAEDKLKEAEKEAKKAKLRVWSNSS